jgi:hypothetical protein
MPSAHNNKAITEVVRHGWGPPIWSVVTERSTVEQSTFESQSAETQLRKNPSSVAEMAAL